MLGSRSFLTPVLGQTINFTPMPTYGYVCAKCGHEFETVQPISARPLAICPETLCSQKRWGKGKVKRAIVAGGGLIFKGSGFYTTDYRSDKYKAAAKQDISASHPKAAETKSGGSDTKPASTPAKTTDKPTKASSGGT